MDSDNQIENALKLLSRGILQPCYKTTYSAYKEVYRIGQPAVPTLKRKILETDWTKSKYKELSRYISGVFSLLHDIDEDEAENVMQRAIEDGCPPHIKAILHSTFEFSVKNYNRYEINDIEIFEHKELKTRCLVSGFLKKWLDNVPPEHLEDISRLYVVPRRKIKASGTYTPALKTIALLWENPHKEKSLMFKLTAFSTENVLYHEIGHHVYNHDFGTKPEQEKEADRYAYNIMKNEYPSFSKFAKLLSMFGMKSQRNYFRWGL